MNERSLAVFRLHLTSQVGSITYRKLLRAFGSPEAALAAPRDRLAEVEGIGAKRAEKISADRANIREAAERELELAAEHGVTVYTLEDEGYPNALRTIYDPPLALYVKGSIRPGDGLALGVVGSRRCSYYGRSQAERFSSNLAGLGFTIVSGLARGVDSSAHRGAISAGGRTFAVLGNGLASVYPPENRDLAEEIAASGALISEFSMKTEPFRDNFPRRNRVISGLSMGVLMIEGDLRSGALITARIAMEQGREVFALPGKVDTPVARGPHALIKDGAKLVESHQDILDEIGPSADILELNRPAGPQGVEETQGSLETAPAVPGLSPQEKRLYQCLSSDPQCIDDIIARTEMSPAEVSAGLLVLEIRRLIRQMPGKVFVRAR